MVLKIGEPKKRRFKHRNLKNPELVGSDGIIVDLSTKICRKNLSFQLYSFSEYGNLYSMTHQYRYVYRLDESYLRWILGQMVELLKHFHCRKQMSCRGISSNHILVEKDGTLKLSTFKCRRTKNRTDTRPNDIFALGEMLLQIYYNIPDFQSYLDPSELFSSSKTWKKLELLSATFGYAPTEISQEMKDIITQMVQPLEKERCNIE